MTKFEWLTSLCKDNTGHTPKVPFSAQEIRGTYVLYATDRHSIIRVPCGEQDAKRYHVSDPYLSGFFDVMKKLYDSTVFKGKIDALLLKDMANEDKFIKLDGAYFSPKAIKRVMVGWEDSEAVLARAVLKSGHLLYGAENRQISVNEKTTELHPLMLHGKHALAIMAPALAEEEEWEEFPKTGVVYNS